MGGRLGTAGLAAELASSKEFKKRGQGNDRETNKGSKQRNTLGSCFDFRGVGSLSLSHVSN